MRLPTFGAVSLVLVGLLAGPALGQEVIPGDLEGFVRVGTLTTWALLVLLAVLAVVGIWYVMRRRRRLNRGLARDRVQRLVEDRDGDRAGRTPPVGARMAE